VLRRGQQTQPRHRRDPHRFSATRGLERADPVDLGEMTARRCTHTAVNAVRLVGMDVTSAVIRAIPEDNVRIPREEFVDVWRTAEGLHDALVAEPMDRAAVAAIVVVCRWLAGVHPRTPVTARAVAATPAEVEAELATMMAGFRLDPLPAWLASPPGWSTGLAFALAWAWLGGDMPLIHHVDGRVVSLLH
jgi:hypothetical protein